MKCKVCNKETISGKRANGMCLRCYYLEYAINKKTIRREYEIRRHTHQRKIANKFDVTQQAISLLEKRALKKFKRNWIKMYGQFPDTITDRKYFDSCIREISRG